MMAERIKVALLYGGNSGEHEVSLRSAASVFSYLDQEKYEIILLGIDKDGLIYQNPCDAFSQQCSVLPIHSAQSILCPSLISNGRFFIEVDVVFPVIHGALYEDGVLQGLLDLAEVAYVGCGVLASALGMNKDMARRVVCDQDIKSTPYRTIQSHFSLAHIETLCDEIIAAFGWPLFVKPCASGSSVGIHKVLNKTELLEAITDAARYDETVMVEAFAKGREIELAVLENKMDPDNPWVSLPGEIEVLHKDGFYSYVAKYIESDQTLLHIPARIQPEISLKIQQAARLIFSRLNCSGMARIDFFVDDVSGSIWFNEINTLPGFTSISMYPKLCESSGIAYPDLLDRLIDLALCRHQRRQQLIRHYAV